MVHLFHNHGRTAACPRHGHMKKTFAAIFAAILILLTVLSTTVRALTDEERDAALREAAQVAIDLVIDESMTDVEKITALHDWLCLNTDYGLAPRAETAYGAIVNGTAVCTGYAEALAYLANLAGLDAVSTYSAAVDHAWILVTLDGERYFCDSTWDDGKNAKMGLIRHQYMLFNEENAADTNRYGWDSPEPVPGGALEGIPWASAITRVIFEGDWAWYIDGEFRLVRCDRETWETEILLDFEDRWPVWEDDSKVYTELYTGLILLRDRLYFNTPWAIYSVDTDGEHLKIEFSPDTTAGLVYGIAIRDGAFCYSLATEPDAVTYEVLDTGLFCWGAWGYESDPADLWAAILQRMGGKTEG